MFDMESKNFDKLIKDKLQNLEADYKPGDWELMEQKLNVADMEANPEFENVLLDGLAYGSLENFKAEYDPNHWDLMEQKLDDTYYPVRQKLYRYKVVEVGLMLLAIFTVIQFLPFKKNKASKELAGTTSQIENVISTVPNAEEASINDNSNQQITGGNASSENANPLADASELSVINGNIPINPNGNFAENINPAVNSIGLAVNDDQPEEAFDIDIPNIETNQFAKKHLDLSIANRFAFNDDNNYPHISILQPINSYEPDKLQAANPSSSLADCTTCNLINSSILVSVGMVGGADADYVTTPYDGEYHQKEFEQISMGYSGGVTLGVKYHKWELETGAIYSAKYYGSRNIFEVNGSFDEGGYVQEGLAGVQLDVVKVPLHLRYNFMSQSKWNVYAHSGASFNMAVETLYEYTSQKIGSTSVDAAQSRSAVNVDPHKDVPTYDGIFEGGDLIDNTYITANLGLGIERHFNSRMSVFLGSTYQHQITKGLGPQSDKINSLSIMTGARVTLQPKKKN